MWFSRARQFKLKCYCVSLFIRKWKGRRSIYNYYLISERHILIRGAWNSRRRNSQWQILQSSKIQYNDRFSCKEFDHRNFRQSVRTKKAPCLSRGAFPFLLKSTKKESSAAQKFLLSRLRQWHSFSFRVEIDEHYGKRWRDHPVAHSIIYILSW